ncbi:hypothetical protein CYMTET_56852 [Cymbomonas tetramitiformis]|uniref:L domain-like protein n=1 Tax=Cymbomonas tetramitiformis TaxID=36881 RepID=A0AAE0BA43_9CHLO|nr:hypothetical protein CYMTET_56852 [Cymbomonas tetramitiformis]
MPFVRLWRSGTWLQLLLLLFARVCDAGDTTLEENADYLACFSEPDSCRELHLLDASLTGTIPTEIGRLTELQILDLRANSLTTTLPSEMGLLSSLISLSVAHNQLAGTIPSEFDELGVMTSLNVSFNEDLCGDIPKDVSYHLDFTFTSLGLPCPSTTSHATVARTTTFPSVVPTTAPTASLSPIMSFCGHIPRDTGTCTDDGGDIIQSLKGVTAAGMLSAVTSSMSGSGGSLQTAVAQMQFVFLFLYLRAPDGVFSKHFLHVSRNLAYSVMRLDEKDVIYNDTQCTGPEDLSSNNDFSLHYWMHTTPSAAQATFWGTQTRTLTYLLTVAVLRKAAHWVWIRLARLDVLTISDMPRVLVYPYSELLSILLLVPSSSHSTGLMLGVKLWPAQMAAAWAYLIILAILICFSSFLGHALRPRSKKRALACYVELRPEDAEDVKLLGYQRHTVLMAHYLHRPAAMWLSPPAQPLVVRRNPLYMTANGDMQEEEKEEKEEKDEESRLLTTEGFVMRYGLLFDNLRGSVLLRPVALSLCMSFRDRSPAAPEALPEDPVCHKVKEIPEEQKAQTLMTRTKLPWSTYYNLLRLGGISIAAVLLGAFAVPCSCEFGDNQPWKCTWPQSLIITWLFALQLGFLLAVRPLHNVAEQFIEVSTCMCNIGIVGTVQLSWHSRWFRDLVVDNQLLLLGLQLGSLCIPVIGMWFMVTLRLVLWLRIRKSSIQEESKYQRKKIHLSESSNEASTANPLTSVYTAPEMQL